MNMTDLSEKELKKLSKLADLEVSDDKLKKLAPQLNEILDFVGKLGRVKTEVSETVEVTGLKNVAEEDNIRESLDHQVAISQARSEHKGYVLVKAVFEEEN